MPRNDPFKYIEEPRVAQRLLGIDPRNLPRDELSRALERQTLAPGLTVVGQRNQPAQTDQGRELLTQAADSNTGVRRVSVTEPDGRTIQVEGSTPFDIASLLEGREGPAVRGGTETAALPEGQQVALPEGPQEAPTPPERGGLLGILERAGRAAGTPRGQILLGSLAEAIGGNSTGGRLGSVARQLGEARAVQEVSQATQQGKETPESASTLSPELQQQAVRTGLALRGAKTEEERAKILNEYTQAQTAATASVAQQKETQLLLEETRQNNRLELQKAEEASRIAVGEALDNRWMNVGEGYVFNWNSGEIRKVYDLADLKGSTRVSNIKSADYKQFLDFAAAEFLPQVWEKYKEEMKTLGFESLVDIQKAFTDPESGTVNYQLVLSRLSPEDKKNFSDALLNYTVGELQGIPRTATFSARINQLARDEGLLEAGAVVNGYRYLGPPTQLGSAEAQTQSNWEKVQ